MAHSRSIKTAVLSVLLLFFSPLPLYAGPPPKLSELLRPKIDFGSHSSMKSDFKDRATAVEINSQAVSASYYGVSLSYRLSNYSWTDAADIGFTGDGSTPWRELHDVSASFRSMLPLPGPWMMNWGVRARSAFERQLSASFSAGGDISLIARVGEKWAGGVGIGLSWTPLTTSVVPAMSLRFDDSDSSGVSATIGVPTRLIYRIDEQWDAVAEVGFVSETYRLKDNSAVAEKGYFRRREIVPKLGMRYEPVKRLRLFFDALYHTDRQWRVYDSDGSRSGRARLKSGPGIAAGASWSF